MTDQILKAELKKIEAKYKKLFTEYKKALGVIENQRERLSVLKRRNHAN